MDRDAALESFRLGVTVMCLGISQSGKKEGFL